MNLKKLFRPKSLAIIGGYWADFVYDGNKTIGYKGKIQLEIEKLKWDLNQHYKKLGKHRQALEMHELYIEMRDSMFSIENKEAIIQQEYKYKYEKEQALADAKHQEQMALSAER